MNLYRLMTDVRAGAGSERIAPGSRGIVTLWVRANSEGEALAHAAAILAKRAYSSIGPLHVYLEEATGDSSAVLGAAGQRVPRRREGPAGLTQREVEVLRLLARGLSNKEIAARLVISPKTAGNHVEHIYAKIHASTRATASLFAMRHGLLRDDEPLTQAV